MADAMLIDHRAKLKQITSFDSLVGYLRDEMDWPIDGDKLEDLSFEYTAEELGIDPASAVKIQEIQRLRPLSVGQPWGIFFVRFEPRRLPVVALRRILSRVVLKKRASANSAERTAWEAEDLLFVSNFGDGADRQICFAHFTLDEQKSDLPTLKVLGWNDLDTPLRLDHVADTLTERLAWPDDERDIEAWRGRWRSAFTLRHREVITTSKILAERLAGLARAIRNRTNMVLSIETGDGPVTKLMEAFREALVHDLDADGFADMYAQTIAYGLLSARIADPKANTADDFAAHMRTNPFLKELMETFLYVGGRRKSGDGLGLDFDELGVSEVVALLDAAKMEAVLRDFGDRKPEEDPVIHFYELFLKEYDAKKRTQRGVFYTPLPVVSYIVRSVHELLQIEFGLPDGLADIATWDDMAKRHPGLALPDGLKPSDRFVTVLDPATGTGTFLVEAIEVIHRTLVDRWKREGHSEEKILDLWNEYVPKHLLPRLHGYELLMAPYAIAHVKVGLKLYETGYRFGSDERARIYLTNALEPAHDFSGHFEFVVPALAHEAEAVSEIKQHKRFTVIIGNPPYSVNSANKKSSIDAESLEYKRDLTGERNLKPLNDDYVKFIRFADMMLRRSGNGLLGMITNHSFTTARLFRSMRRSLLATFRTIYFLDLRGDTSRDPKMTQDQNVFDIQQGVGIGIYCRISSRATSTIPAYLYELIGPRDAKYSWLSRHSSGSTPWIGLRPCPELYSLQPADQDVNEEYEEFLPVSRVFGLGNVGYQTHRDDFVIDLTREDVITRLAAFRDARLSEEQLTERFGIHSNSDWSLGLAHQALIADIDYESHVMSTLYRPFDIRYIVYAPYLLDRSRGDLMAHMTIGNYGLLVSKVFDEHEFTSVLATKWIVESKVADRTRGSHLFPLRLIPAAGQMRLESVVEIEWRTNFSFEIQRWLEHMLKIKMFMGVVPTGSQGVADSDVFGYIYAILHSPEYRTRYANLLKSNFPRVPLTSSLDLFLSLARLGSEIVALHLIESPKLERRITTYVGPKYPEVERVGWSDETVWIDAVKSKKGTAEASVTGTVGFRGVPEEVWNFHIGGYQVCEKWLKDRRGRTLTAEDITHYHRVVIALHETIRIMREIDEVIEAHGGWPSAFATDRLPEAAAG